MTNSDILHKLKRIDELFLDIKSITTCSKIDDMCVEGIEAVGSIADSLVPSVAREVDPMM